MFSQSIEASRRANTYHNFYLLQMTTIIIIHITSISIVSSISVVNPKHNFQLLQMRKITD